MCVGLPKTAELLFLAALFFGSFFCTSKRKNINLVVSSVPSFIQTDKEYLKKIRNRYAWLVTKHLLQRNRQVI